MIDTTRCAEEHKRLMFGSDYATDRAIRQSFMSAKIRTAYNDASVSLRPLVTAALYLRMLLRRDFLVLAWYLLVSLAALFPVLHDPRNVILGELGDNIHYVYMTGWSAQSLLMGQSPFVDPRLNYPDDLAFASNDAPYLSFLLVAPATWILGPVFGYNLVIFLSHFLSGYFTYLWVRSLTNHRFAAVFAGTVFVLAPFRIFRSLGHANIVSTHMIPLFFWMLDRCVSKQDIREVRLWLLGLATFLVAGCSQYLLIICLVSGALYALYALMPDFRFILTRRWKIAASVLLGAIIGSLPYISVLGGGGFEPYNIGRTRLWSADPVNFLLPSSLHPLWGDWINGIRPEPYAGEKTLYLGVVALSMAVVGGYYLYRHSNERKQLIVWVLTALSAAIFALGTDLWINNQPISRDNPVWLPAYYLAQLPLVDVMRVWSRFGVITLFFVAILSAYGVTYVLQRGRDRRWKSVVGIVLLAALIVDFLPGRLPSATLQARPIDVWLAQQEGDFAVAFLPVDKPLLNDIAIFGSLFHGKQMPAYLHAAHLPRAYQDFADIVLDFPSSYSIQYLSWRDIRFIILDKEQYNGWRAPQWSDIETSIRQFPELQRITEVENFVVLSIANEPER